MKKLLLAALLIIILTLALASAALADEMQPMYACPDNFELHMHNSDGDPMDGDHHHVGLGMDVADKNGDGYICMKHVGNSGMNHVHIDNNVPLP